MGTIASTDFSIRGDTTLDGSGLSAGLNALTVTAGNLLAGLVAKAADAAAKVVTSIISTGVQFNAQMETYQMGLTNLLGSAEAANAALEAIKADAARTPFDVAGLVQANQYLISTGINAENARSTINALGDAVAATGGTSETLTRMAQNLQQISNVGKATAMDIRQFAMAGIDIYGVLADYTGKTTAEVQELDVTYDLLSAALQAAAQEGGRFYGAMDTQSQTLNGRISTLRDNFTQFAGALTEGLFEGEKAIVEAAISWVQTLQDTLLSEGPGAMLESGLEIALEFVAGIADALPDVINAGIQTAADFISGIVNRMPEIAESGGEIVGKLIAGIVSVAANLGSAAVQLIETFVIQFLTFEWADVGISIVKGIISGFISALPKLAETVINGIKNIGKAAQNAAEAASDNLAIPVIKATASAGDAWEAYNARVASIRERHNASVQSAAAAAKSFADTAAASASKVAASAEKVLTAAEKLANTLKEQNSAIDDTQAAYKTLSAAVEEYNTHGRLSIDTTQALLALDDKYIALLQQEGDTLAIDADAYRKMLDEQINALSATEELREQSAGLILVLQQMRDAVDNASESFSELATESVQKISDMWDEINSETQDGVIGMAAALYSAVQNQDWKTVAVTIGKFLFGTLPLETRQNITAWVLNAVQQINTGFAEDGLAGLVQAGASVVQSLTTGLQNNSSTLLTAAQSLLGNFQSVVSNGFHAAVSSAGKLLGSLQSIAGNSFQYIVTAASKLTGGFQSIVGTGFHSTVSTAGKLLGTLQSIAGTSFQAVASAGSALAQGLKSIVQGGFQPMTSASTLLSSAMNVLSPVIGVASQAMGVLNTVMAANPILFVITAIGVLVTALYSFSKANSTVGSGFAKVWKGIKAVFDFVIDAILVSLGVMIQGFVSAINLIISAANVIPGVNIQKISNPFFNAVAERRAQKEKEDAALAEQEKQLAGATEAVQIEIPEIESPEVNVPEVKIPEIELPEVNVPEVKIPEIELPEVNVPEVSLPEANIPTTESPVITLPAIEWPDYTVPKLDNDFSDAAGNLTDAVEDQTEAIVDQTEATKEAIAATQEALAEMVRQAKGLVLSDNMAVANRVAANGSAYTAQLAAAYQTANNGAQPAAGTTVVQNIYSKAQTAADLARETRWEYDRAART